MLSFTTPAAPTPCVTTIAATSVTGTARDAERLGEPERRADDRLVPLRDDQPGHLQRHLRHARAGQRAAPRSARARSPVAYSQALTGLTPGTTYYFCAIAQNAVGTVVRRGAVVHDAGRADGHDRSAATQRRQHDARRSTARPTRTAPRRPAGSATRRPTRAPATTRFGTRAPTTGGTVARRRHDRRSPSRRRSPGSPPDTTYYFCAIAQNGAGTAFGAVRSFTTPLAPTVTDRWPRPASPAPRRRSTARRTRTARTTTGWFRYEHDQPGHLQRHLRHARRRRAAAPRSAPAAAAVPYAQTLTGPRRRARPTTSARSPRNSVGTGVRRGAVVHDAGARRSSTTAPRHARHRRRGARSTARRTRNWPRRPASSATPRPTRAPATTPSARAPRRRGGTVARRGHRDGRVLADAHRPHAGHDLLLLRHRHRTPRAPASARSLSFTTLARAERDHRRRRRGVTSTGRDASTARRTRTATPRRAGSATARRTRAPATTPSARARRRAAAPSLGAGTTAVDVLAGRSPACTPGDDVLLLRHRVRTRSAPRFGAVLSFTTPRRRRR